MAAEEATLRAAATRDQRLTEAATAEMAELAQAESRFGGGWWRGLVGVSRFPPEKGGGVRCCVVGVGQFQECGIQCSCSVKSTFRLQNLKWATSTWLLFSTGVTGRSVSGQASHVR